MLFVRLPVKLPVGPGETGPSSPQVIPSAPAGGIPATDETPYSKFKGLGIVRVDDTSLPPESVYENPHNVAIQSFGIVVVTPPATGTVPSPALAVFVSRRLAH